MTSLVPFSRVKGNEKSALKTPGFVLNKAEDLNSIVVMSGSAKRRRLETDESPAVKMIPNDHKEKLRAPFYKSHQKQAQTEERVMTKSCEILLECIKPYKEIRVARRTQVTESTRTIGSILTTDVVYERKATRKVQFVNFCDENQPPTAFPHKQTPASLLPEPDDKPIIQDFLKTEHQHTDTGKAVSSEDFITRVFNESFFT